LKGLDRRLQNETGVPVHLAEYPMECIAQGTGKMLGFNSESTGRLGAMLASSPLSKEPKTEDHMENGQ
jgi:rod shape-determining protein MreB